METLETRIARTLHDEHLETLGCLGQLESVLTSRGRAQVPESGDAELAGVLGRIRALVKSDLDAHFRVEEESLFPLVGEAGDDGIGVMLTEEHRIILPIGRRLAALADRVLSDGFTGGTWQELRMLGLELSERLASHIQKEEMGLLPMVDSLIDEQQDTALWERYLSSR